MGQGEDAGKEPEDPREGVVKGRLREDTPGEDEEDSYDHFDDGKQPPGRDFGNSRVSRAGLLDLEEFGGDAVLEESPATKDVPQNDRDEGDRIFETWAIIDGLRVLVHHEQADRGRGEGDWIGS